MLEMLDKIYFGSSLTRWLIALGVMVGVATIGRVAVVVLRLSARRIGSRLAIEAVEHTGEPLATISTLFGIRLAMESLVLPARVAELSATGLKLMLSIAVTWLIVRVYDAIHDGIFVPYSRRGEARIELHFFVILRNIMRLLLWLVGIATALSGVGIEVSAVLAGLGIGGMAIALASQDTVANVFGGVLVLLQRPFKAGERIEVAGINGWVQAIGLRNTAVRNWYGRTVLIPNKKFTDSVLTNIDSQSAYVEELRLRFDPRTPAESVERGLQIIRQIALECELLEKPSWVALDKIDRGYIEVEFWYSITKWSPKEQDRFADEYQKVCQAKTSVNLELLRRFEAAGIRLALPSEARLGLTPEQARPKTAA